MRETRQHEITELADSRFDWPTAFHELARVMPSDASLNSVDGVVTAAATPTVVAPVAAAPAAALAPAATPVAAAATSTVTSATPPGSLPVFTISGCATSQGEVARTLERLRLVNGVSEVNLQSSSKSGGGASGGAGSGGGCPSGDPSFAVQVAFDALPTQSATTTGSTAGGSDGSGSTTTASASGSASAAPASSTTTGAPR